MRKLAMTTKPSDECGREVVALKGDFTRWTYWRKKHYRNVNMQQGRTQIDADWNEQNSINFHYETASLRDVIGRSGTPVDSSRWVQRRISGPVPQLIRNSSRTAPPAPSSRWRGTGSRPVIPSP